MIGERLAFARRSAGLSIEQAARLLGTKPRFIKDCEESKYDLAGDGYVAEQFAELYDVSLDWLARGVSKDLSSWTEQLAKLREPDRTKLIKLLESMP